MKEEKLKQEAEEYAKKHEMKSFCAVADVYVSDKDEIVKAILRFAVPREKKIEELEQQIKKMSELINRYYEVCAQIPRELRSMVFDSCLEDTRKIVNNKEMKEND